MRKLSMRDLIVGGTGPVLAGLVSGGGIDRGGFRRYDEPGFRTHDEPGPHVHGVPEIFCIYQGSGTVEVDGAPAAGFEAGDVLIIEPGEDHHLISTGALPLVFTWMHLSPPEPA